MLVGVKQLAYTVLGPFMEDHYKPEDIRRLSLLVGLSVIGIIFLIIFGMVAYQQGNVILSVLDLLTSIVLLINLWDLARRKDVKTNIYVGLLFISLLYIYLIITGGVNNTAYVWYFTYPLIACYLMGSRVGCLASFFMLLPVILLMIIKPESVFFTHYSLSFMVRFMAAYIVISFFSYLFERTREINQVELDLINRSLEDLVNKRTSELISVNEKLVEDINRREKAEKELEISEKRYRLLFEKAEDAIFILNSEKGELGRIVDANQSAAIMHGYSIEELKQLNIKDLNPKADADKIKQRIHSIKRGDWSKIEIEHVRKDGTPFPIEVSAGFLQIDDQQYIMTIDRDISDRKAFEKRIRRAEKMEAIGVLAGGIAHDFNNILTPIIGHAQLILIDLNEGEPLRENIEKIIDSANRAKDLVDQILTFSRQEEDRMGPVYLLPIVKEAIKMIRSIIPASIEIREHLHTDNDVINANPTQMHQVVMNVLTNAFHAIQERVGTITVRVYRVDAEEILTLEFQKASGRYVCLEIEDTGIGMEDTVRPRIFEPFFTTKKKGKGTGMGLSVVHGIVNRMNGIVQVQSAVGKGTRFTFYFPLVDKLPEPVYPDRAQDLVQGTGHILLIDDESDIIETGSHMLQLLGYTVDAFEDAVVAMDAFEQDPDRFDLVISDFSMPRLPGDQVIRKIRSLKTDIPVIIITGFSDKKVVAAMEKEGSEKILKKPFVLRDLSIAVNEVLIGKTHNLSTHSDL